jgi:hypothetical protein
MTVHPSVASGSGIEPKALAPLQVIEYSDAAQAGLQLVLVLQI